jgi:predicted metal-dependent hydrolase
VSKSKRVAEMVVRHQGRKLDAHYLGYFDYFNQRLFYEAHDVLEHLWLPDKYGPNGAFYKGLIQLAGAFVHLQKNRLRPAAALFKLALTNLEKYPRLHERLNVATTCELARKWLEEVERGRFDVNPLTDQNAPALGLELEMHER